MNANIYDTEYALIGEILKQPEIMAECMTELSADDFFDSSLGRIYSVCASLWTEGKTIDPLTVLYELGGDKGAYKELLYNCYQSGAIVCDYKAHIRMIAESAMMRELKSDAYALLSEIDIMTPSEIRESLLTSLKRIDGRGATDVKTLAELHAEFIEWQYSDEKYIETGLSTVDKHLKISRGDYVVIGGRPSSGKTALTIQLAMNMAKQMNVTYFSLETESRKIYERIVANGSRTPFGDIKNRTLKNAPPEVWKKINNFSIYATENCSLKVASAAGWDLNKIRSTALQLKSDVIFIDYLTLVESDNKTQYEKATAISKGLHTLAQRDKIAVIAVAQMNRQADPDRPSMSDLRESGQIEQDADAILLLNPKNPLDEDCEVCRKKLYLVKNKEGITGEFHMNFWGQYQMFAPEERGETT